MNTPNLRNAMGTVLILAAFGVTLFVALVIVNRQHIVNRIWHPGYSACFRCHKTWDVVRGHDTLYGDSVWKVTTPNDPDSPVQIVGAPNDGGTYEVTVNGGMGCFPLCEGCWTKLETPEARLPYYRQLIDDWKEYDPSYEKSWPRLKAAVMEGK